jgi:hypothetical protein
MRKIITFDKGSKKKLQTIRWTRSEIVSGLLLACLMIAACFAALMWSLSDESDEPQTPSLVIKR